MGGRLLDLSTPAVMGIVNVTHDSFFDGGRYLGEKELVSKVGSLIGDGASILDVGAASSRPGAAMLPVEEEKARAVWAIQIILHHFPGTLLSIDTFHSEVARAAIGEGAVMINDVSGGELDAGMFQLLPELNVPYVLMHMRGTPLNMNSYASYDDLITEILRWLQVRLNRLREIGVKDVVIDPGFGFAKTVEQNFTLLKKFHLFRMLDAPLLAGLSRKSMVWRTLSVTPAEALNGTTVLNTVALANGASILRVHDAREAAEAIRLYQKVSAA